MRIARVPLGATARGMTQQDGVTSTTPGAAGSHAEAAAAGRVYLRTPQRGDRAEFVSLMRASRAFHRPWATAPTSRQ